jgi:aminomethyltransferase
VYFTAEGAMPINAQAKGLSTLTLWRAALNCPPKGLTLFKCNLSGIKDRGATIRNPMAPTPSRTIFFQSHIDLGAKMIDFGGWEMPIHYGSQISEHIHTRNVSSIFDVSHMAVVDLFGKSSEQFLKFLLANNVAKIEVPNRGLYSCMLNPDGGIIDDLIVYHLEDRYRLVINASTAANDLTWILEQSKNYPSVEIIPRRLGLGQCHAPEVLLAIQGPQALKSLQIAFPNISHELESISYFQARFLPSAFGNLMFARTGYTGEDGFEISIPLENGNAVWDYLTQSPHNVLPAGLGARDTLRIEAGYNLYGQDMNSSTSPLDSGLGWTVELQSERDFIGKNALLKNGKQWDFLGLVLLSKGILRAHQQVVTPFGNGEICSGTYSPSLEKSIGLARLPIGQILNSVVQVNIRNQLIDAKIVKPQFVRKGQILI